MAIKIGSKDEDEDETLLKNYKKPRYFICSSCGEITTWKEILDECANGGIGMCMCEWVEWMWDDEEEDFDYITNRIYKEYTEISYRWYEFLKIDLNEALRLRKFNQIPKDKLLEDYEDDDEE